jgi:hypothetical protein
MLATRWQWMPVRRQILPAAAAEFERRKILVPAARAHCAQN